MEDWQESSQQGMPISARPYSRQAEESVLGCMILSRHAATELLAMLSASDFYQPIHGRIFGSIEALWNEAKAVDSITIAEKLRQRGDLEKFGGHEKLMYLSTVVPNVVHASRYGEIVLEHSQRRRVEDECLKIIGMARDTDQPIEDVLDTAERQMLNINDSVARSGGGLRPMFQVMNETMESLDKDSDKENLLTGLVDVDKQLGGLAPGSVIVVAGRPSMGKSAFVQTIACNVAEEGKVVAFFSLEMSAREVAIRFLSMRGQIRSNIFQSRGGLSETVWVKVLKAVEAMAGWKIYIDDSAAPKVTEIRAKCRRLRQEQGTLDLVIVDYLQLMPATGRTFRSADNRQQEISDISRELKVLARELDAPVICVSQLNRAVETRGGDKRPVLSDLRESGAIEQDADVVMFLYREGYYKSENADLSNRAEVLIRKNRHGPTGKTDVSFLKEFTLFHNATRTGEASGYKPS